MLTKQFREFERWADNSYKHSKKSTKKLESEIQKLKKKAAGDISLQEYSNIMYEIKQIQSEIDYLEFWNGK